MVTKIIIKAIIKSKRNYKKQMLVTEKIIKINT